MARKTRTTKARKAPRKPVATTGAFDTLIRNLIAARREAPRLKSTGQIKVTGYRELSKGELAAVNHIKEVSLFVGGLVLALDGPVKAGGDPAAFIPDPRWLAIAKTDLQKGFMALIRAVTKPEGF